MPTTLPEIQRLIEQLSADDTQVKEQAAKTLGDLTRDVADLEQIVGARVVKPLMGLLANGSPQEQEQAARALGNLATSIAGAQQIVAAAGVELFVDMLTDDNLQLRLSAAIVLGNLASKNVANKDRIVAAKAIATLVDLLTGDSLEMRGLAARLLALLAANHVGNQGRIGEANAIAPLLGLLTSDDPLARQYGAAAIGFLAKGHVRNQGRIAKADAIKPLVGLLTSEQPQKVRRAASGAIGFLASRHVANQTQIAAAGAIERLVGLLTDDDPLVRQNTTRTLLNLASKNVTNKDRMVAANAIPPLVALLAGAKTELRAYVARLLMGLVSSDEARKQIRNASREDVLITVLKEESSHTVQFFVAWAIYNLTQIPGKKDAIRHAGGVDAISTLLDSEDEGVLRYAMQALGSLARKNASNQNYCRNLGVLPRLIEYAVHTEPKLAANALWSLYHLARENLENKKFIKQRGKSVEAALTARLGLLSGDDKKEAGVIKWVLNIIEKKPVEINHDQLKKEFESAIEKNDLSKIKRISELSPDLLQEMYGNGRVPVSAISYASLHAGEHKNFDSVSWFFSHPAISKPDKSKAMLRLFHQETEVVDGYTQSYLKRLQAFVKQPGLPLNVRTSEGKTLMMQAAEKGWAPIFKFLCGQPGLSVTDKDNAGVSVCLHASHSLPLLKFLASKGAFSLSDTDPDGENVFLRAAGMRYRSSAKLVEWISEQPGFSLEVRDRRGRTALLLAASTGYSLPVIQWLLQQPGVSLSERDDQGKSAFQLAVEALLTEWRSRKVLPFLVEKMLAEGLAEDDKAYAKNVLSQYAKDPKKKFLVAQLEKITGPLVESEEKESYVVSQPHVALSDLLGKKVVSVSRLVGPSTSSSLEQKKVGGHLTLNQALSKELLDLLLSETDLSSTLVLHGASCNHNIQQAHGAFQAALLVIDEFSTFPKEALIQCISRLRCVDTLYLCLSEELLSFLKPLFPVLTQGLRIVLDSPNQLMVQKFLVALPTGFTVSVRKKEALTQAQHLAALKYLPAETGYMHYELAESMVDQQREVLAALPKQVKLVCEKPALPVGDSLLGKIWLLQDYKNQQLGTILAEKETPVITASTPIESYASMLKRGSHPFLYNSLPDERIIPLTTALGSRPIRVSSLVSTVCIEKLLGSGIKVNFGSQMGISDKYLCPLPYKLGNPNRPEHPEPPALPPHKLDFVRFDDVLAQLVVAEGERRKIYKRQIVLNGVSMALFKSYKGYDASKPTVFVFAGRKERAMLPPIHASYSTVLVLTQIEYESLFKDAQEKTAALQGVSILVVESIQRPYKKEPDDISTITSRRLAVLCCARKLQLKHMIMLDDNIDQVFLTGANPNFLSAYQVLLNRSNRYRQSFVSVASYSHKHKRYDESSLGSKCHLWNLEMIEKNCPLLATNGLPWISLMPENEHYWGQVLYAQILLRELVGNTLSTGIFPADKMVLQRSQRYTNSTQLRGVRAQPLPFTPAYQVFLQSIHADLHASVHRVICIFNYQVNEQIALMRKRIHRLLTLDLEAEHAKRNKVPVQLLPLHDVDLSFAENVKRCLQSLLDKRPGIDSQAAGFKPYDHQWKALQYAVDTISKTGEFDMTLFEMATGTGKTFVQSVISLAAIASTEGTVVYLSPRIELAEQSYHAMLHYIDAFPALAESFGVSKSRILKIFSGSDAALTKRAILANECLHPRYLMVACMDSFYKLLEEESFREHMRLIVFDESHLTFKPSKLLAIVEGQPDREAFLENCSIAAFSATPKGNFADRFYFGREEAIHKGLLAPLHVDKISLKYLRSDEGVLHENVIKLLKSHRLPGGQLLLHTKGIIFVESQAEAKALVGYLKSQMEYLACYQISSNNTHHQKELREFRSKKMAIAVAVDMLIVGFDERKMTWCINLKRKINERKKIQAHGRFLRRDPDNPNKIGTVLMLKGIRAKSIFPPGRSVPESYQRAKDTLNKLSSEASSEAQTIDPEGPQRKKPCISGLEKEAEPAQTQQEPEEPRQKRVCINKPQDEATDQVTRILAQNSVLSSAPASQQARFGDSCSF
jgi:superfamily II DNA or RNA helicase/HEAT repeat protein